MKETIINFILILSAIGTLTALGFFVRIGAVADSVAIVRIEGLKFKPLPPVIRRAVESKKGIASLYVDADTDSLTVGYDSKAISPEQMVGELGKGGFTAKVEKVLTVERYKAIAGRDFRKRCEGCCIHAR